MLNALGMSYSEVKIKPYLKMAVQRIQIANNKKLTSVKHQKREVATLLGEQKDEKARIKVEHIIRDDFMIEAYELLELLCELLHERIRQITTNKECPPELKETVCSLIWAASNCDISELSEVKKHLVRKFGPKFAKEAEENENGVVNIRLFNKLSYKPPSRQLVTGYLVEIANVYKVDWTPPIELEGELFADEETPFSTPSGFSVNMAPGSGLTGAYAPSPGGNSPSPAGCAEIGGLTAQPVGPPSNKGMRKLTAEEQAEYAQFHTNQKKPVTAPTYTPPVVYAAVPGPPPRPNSQNTGPTSGPPPTSQNNQNSGPAPASPSVTVAVSMPPAEILEEMEYAQQEEREETPPLYTKGEEMPSLSAPSATPPSHPPPPPPTEPAPTAPAPSPAAPVVAPAGDPMESMLARLAALQHR